MDDKQQIDELTSILGKYTLSAPAWNSAGFKNRLDTKYRSALDILRLANVKVSDLEDRIPDVKRYEERIRNRVSIETVYAPYVNIQQAEQAQFLKDEGLRLPTDIDYDSVYGLSLAEKVILNTTKPETLGQARRIEGVTPAGCVRLLGIVQRQDRERQFTELSDLAPLGSEPDTLDAEARTRDLV